MMVPGSMPKMIFDAFCKWGLNFTNKQFLEQKYKINIQLHPWSNALCVGGV